MNLFTEMTPKQKKLTEKRNELIDQQDGLKAHHYRTETTILTDDDKKFDDLKKQIEAIDAELK